MNIKKILFNKNIDKDGEYTKYKALFGLIYLKYNNISKTFDFRICGLSEFLSQTDVPIDVLYTGFRQRQVFNDMTVEQVMSGFGLNKLPNLNSNKVVEFNMAEISQKECLEKIVENN